MMVSNIVKLRVILHPAAKNTCITDFINDTEPIVKISVSEIPENGKANEALIKLLSKTLNIAKTDILIKFDVLFLSSHYIIRAFSKFDFWGVFEM